nr:PREDICTED: uncharacterized protein LOC108220271 isoform X2 [Daucus carota subsp. sativus]XP_017249486.1 PREDICTED: uncharacterized protein LOC108220271 isoform X2 [Daucus carota subsp. sativus]
MNKKDEVSKKDKIQVVKLDKAFKLAEKWVKNMSKSSEDQSTKGPLKARPPRLGLGAAVPRQTPVAPSSDPVERKLRGNLDAAKRKAAKDVLESVPSARDESVDEDSEEELESRSKAISKRPATNSNSSLQSYMKGASPNDQTSFPWFVHAYISLGISFCAITCLGIFVAHTAYSHFLSCVPFSIPKTLMMAHLFLSLEWEKGPDREIRRFQRLCGVGF